MASKEQRRPTERDELILAALACTPLTAEQLLMLSAIWPETMPFKTERTVRERLFKLVQAGWVRRSWYAIASPGGSPGYYQLTRAGFTQLWPKATVPKKGYFKEVAVPDHPHTRGLADFIVHTFVAAARRNVQLVDCRRENSLRIPVDGETLKPDFTMTLKMPGGDAFNYFVEVDNSTETIKQPDDEDSIQRKIRLYESLLDEWRADKRSFRVLVATLRSRERCDNILAAANEFTRHRQRSLFYGIYLPDYQAEPDALTAPCFTDHRGDQVALLPKEAKQITPGTKSVRPFLVAA